MRVITTFSRAEHERLAGGVIRLRRIFGVGGVDDEQHVARQAVGEPLDLGGRQIGAGRIVRIGEKDDFRARGDLGENGVDVGGDVGLGRDDRRSARGENGDLVDEKAVLGENAFIARRRYRPLARR